MLLVEAGVDYGDLDDYPDSLRNGYNLAANLPGDPHGWSYIGRLNDDVSYPVTRGKVVGGSSAVNGGQFTRGTPDDFDGWACAGNDEWSFEKVLPYFTKLENDLDFGAGDWHGGAGPVPVRRAREDELNAVARAFVEAALELGHQWDPDMNSPTSVGVGVLPHNVVAGARYNAAAAYLPVANRPAGLTVADRTLALKLLFDGSRACGARVVRDGRTLDVHAGEVVLSAGGLNSPHLLLLSGVGPADELRRLGIDPINHLPAVGKNLTDHPAVNLTYTARRYQPPARDEPAAQVCLNGTAPGSRHPSDMRIFPYSTSKAGMLLGGREERDRRMPPALRRPLAALRALRGASAAALREDVRHRSDLGVYCGVEVEESRGELTMVSPEPTRTPRVNYNYLSEKSDRERLREGARLTRELFNHHSFHGLGVEVTGPTDAELRSDSSLDAWVRTHVRTAYHTSGTCRMGSPDDPASVVDQHCRVIGIDGLRIVDTSIMPRLTRRGTNATAIMLAERASEFFG